jgi:Lon protease-like protein
MRHYMKPHRLARFIALIGLLCTPVSVWAQPARPDAVPRADKLPATIPLFPLQDVMLFPNVSRPLLIFEPRYRAMVADALKGDRIIGMVMLRPGHEADYEGRPPVFPIGCAGMITEVEQLPDGRYTIVLHGAVKFRITSEDHSRPYRVARVEALPETVDDDERAALRAERSQLVSLVMASIEPGSRPPPTSLGDEDLVNVIAQYLDIDPTQRQDLLERKGPLSRLRALVELLALR